MVFIAEMPDATAPTEFLGADHLAIPWFASMFRAIDLGIVIVHYHLPFWILSLMSSSIRLASHSWSTYRW